MSLSTLQSGKSCKAQIRDILIKDGGWLTTNEIILKVVNMSPPTIRAELAILSGDKLIDKEAQNGKLARFRANLRTATITDKKPQTPEAPSMAEQVCAALLKSGSPMTRADLAPLIVRCRKTGISSVLASLHHAGWIGYTPNADGVKGTYWPNQRTSQYASRTAQPRKKPEAPKEEEPEPPSFKPMYASAIALPRGMPSFTPLPRQTWEPPRGPDQIIPPRGF